MGLTIRTAVKSDVPLLLQLIRELAEYEKLSHEVVATESLLTEHLFGRRPVAEALVAMDDGEPVGYALFFHNFSTFLGLPGLYLEDIYVRQHARGKGIGRAMLQRVASIATDRGCGRVEWSVLDWNEPAIGFYKKLGAAPMSDWTVFGVTGDALQALASDGAT